MCSVQAQPKPDPFKPLTGQEIFLKPTVASTPTSALDGWVVPTEVEAFLDRQRWAWILKTYCY